MKIHLSKFAHCLVEIHEEATLGNGWNKFIESLLKQLIVSICIFLHFITNEAKWSTKGSFFPEDADLFLHLLGVCVTSGWSRGKRRMYQMYISIPRITSSIMMS